MTNETSGNGNKPPYLSPLYKPLGSRSFRLISLIPAKSVSSPPKCVMNDYKLLGDNCPLYEALSYTWGNPQSSLPITLNGYSVHVSPNLYTALQYLRKRIGRRVLWIDALCINQTDSTERNHQVSQMRDIFSNAWQVIAWLGESEKGSEYVMQTLGHDPKAKRFPASARPYAVEEFLKRPYWGRVWIVQELIVAKRVTLKCGPYSVPWSAFEDFIRGKDLISEEAFIELILRARAPKSMVSLLWIHFQCFVHEKWFMHRRPPWALPSWADIVATKNMVSPSLWKEREKLAILRSRRQELYPSLAALIYACQSSLATDSRDTVFALLGLVARGRGLDLKPDYSLSACDVFSCAIRVMHLDELDIRSASRSKPIESMDKLGRHNPLDKFTSERLHCDGVDCGTRGICFNMPSLLGIDEVVLSWYKIS